MKIVIKPINHALSDDYFEFFDNKAFSDHAEWSCCYCTFFHMDKAKEQCVEDKVRADGGGEAALRRSLKNTATSLLNDNTLRGYLAYVDGVPIGWCNANDKEIFLRFDFNAEIDTFIRGSGSGKIKTVTCFVIAPEYRGKGVATALLKRVCEDAKIDGYTAVDGYPRLHDQREAFDFNGPVRLYEKAGFVEVARHGNVTIIRKELESGQ